MFLCFSNNCNKPVTDKVTQSNVKLGTLKIKPEVCLYLHVCIAYITNVTLLSMMVLNSRDCLKKCCPIFSHPKAHVTVSFT